MSSNYYFQADQQAILGDAPKYFYGIRRTASGQLYLSRVNQLDQNAQIEINVSGDELENFTGYEEGIDFFEGRNVKHEIVYDNLKYEQYRWDNRSLLYYVNDNGELVLRINQKYDYPSGI
jgi:hypothetical protein